MSDSSQSQQRQPRPCGECGLCCKLIAVGEIGKPAGRWCQHFTIGKGCSIYSERPRACQSYQCIWTMMHSFGEEWRPDRAKFLMDAGPDQIVICPDPGTPDAWRREPFYSRIRALSARTRQPFALVLVRQRGRMIVVFPETEIDLGPEQPDMEVQSGYEFVAGRPVPYARFAARRPAS